MEADFTGLKAWRLRKGIQLDAISKTTKLSVSQLEAIEAGEFKKLPGGVYVLNYIRQYARAIDFDEIELVDWYRASLTATPVRETPKTKRPPTRFGLMFQN